MPAGSATAKVALLEKLKSRLSAVPAPRLRPPTFPADHPYEGDATVVVAGVTRVNPGCSGETSVPKSKRRGATSSAPRSGAAPSDRASPSTSTATGVTTPRSTAAEPGRMR